MAIVMKNNPTVTILGTAVSSSYDRKDNCISVVVEIADCPDRYELLFYLPDVRSYKVTGTRRDLAQASSDNERGDDVPASVDFLD